MKSDPKNIALVYGVALLIAVIVGVGAAAGFQLPEAAPTATAVSCTSGRSVMRYPPNQIESATTDRDGTTVVLVNGTRIVMSPAMECVIVTTRTAF